MKGTIQKSLRGSHSSSDSSNEEAAFKMMRLDLELMGFEKKMIEALIENEDVIEDINHAVELLVRGPNGWLHKFAKNPFTQLCKICNAYAMDHISELNRI